MPVFEKGEEQLRESLETPITQGYQQYIVSLTEEILKHGPT